MTQLPEKNTGTAPITPPAPPQGRTWHLAAFTFCAAVTALLLCCGGSPAYAAETPAAASNGVPVHQQTLGGVSAYQLPNGLQVLLSPDHSKPAVTVNITYKVGSRHEGLGETGIAHLLEHLLFKGTPSYPKLPPEFSKRGMSWNATTSQDRTNYFETFPSGDEPLEWALRMEADRMVNATISKADLDTEMTVVRNEMESRENSPFAILDERALAAAYQWHNYGKPVIGARSDVENVPIERIRDFYRRHYRPDNAVLIVAGDFAPAPTLQRIAAIFGAIPRPATPLPAEYTLDFAQDGERLVTLRRPGGQKIVKAVYHIVPAGHPDFSALNVFSTVIADTPTGRLHHALVDAGLAASVDGITLPMHDPGTMQFNAVLDAKANHERVRKILLEVIEGLVRRPLTATEVEQAKRKELNVVERILQTPQELATALSDAAGHGDWRLFFTDYERLKRLTAAEVQRVALQYVKPENRTVGLFLPTAQPDRAPPPARVDVAAAVAEVPVTLRVEPGETFDTSPAAIAERIIVRTAANGMKLALLPKRTRGEVVHVAMRLDFGTEESLWGQAANLQAAAAMLTRGAGGLSRRQLELTLDRLRAEWQVEAHPQGLNLWLKTRRAHFPEALGLLLKLLREPDFPPAELASLQREWKAALDEAATQPEALANDALQQAGTPYPPGHPLRTLSIAELRRAVDGIRRQDLQRLQRELFGADHLEVAIVGEFDPAAAEKVLAPLQQWTARQPYRRLTQRLDNPGPSHALITTPDKANAVLVGKVPVALSMDLENYPPLALANFLLGGMFESRLRTRIREREGLSYDVSSTLTASVDHEVGELGIHAIYAPANRAALEQAVREELARASREGFTAAEVEHARTAALQHRKHARADDLSLASMLVNQLFFGRDMRWEAELDRRVAAIGVDEVNRVFRSKVAVDRMRYVAAGDFRAGQAPAAGPATAGVAPRQPQTAQ